jgi:hypothetical protein
MRDEHKYKNGLDPGSLKATTALDMFPTRYGATMKQRSPEVMANNLW